MGGMLVRLWIEGWRPLAGRIQLADGPAQTFHGWLELLGQLERIESDAEVVGDGTSPAMPAEEAATSPGGPPGPRARPSS